MLLLLQGPAGSGKSQIYERLLANGEYDIVCDYTALWVAFTAVSRDPNTGLYPVRGSTPLTDSGTINYVKTVAVRRALAEELNTIVTTASRGQEDYWAEIAAQVSTEYQVRTVDPGYDVVAERLASQTNGILSDECSRALGRWY